jgi:Protein of unknown function (DUF3102)
MLEAKDQVPHGEFVSWVERSFKITYGHAKNYMKLARATGDMENRTPAGSYEH